MPWRRVIRNAGNPIGSVAMRSGSAAVKAGGGGGGEAEVEDEARGLDVETAPDRLG
jgi:hypothetical protein